MRRRGTITECQYYDPDNVTSLVAGQHLHSDDGVYEEEHGDEETHVREGLLGEREGRDISLMLSV